MKIFISWSGESSRAVAEILHWWLPKVIQGLKPFVSAKDIDKGANWTVELARELEETEFGIACLTPDNLKSAWLHYEVGAITKSVDSRVCPVLFGVTREDVVAPLSQLQLTVLEREDVGRMLTSINATAGSLLSETDLDDALDMWWPRLEERLAAIEVDPAGKKSPASAATSEPVPPQTTADDMLAEILDHVRRLTAVSEPEPIRRPSLTNMQRKEFLAGLARWPEVDVIASGSSPFVDPDGRPGFRITVRERPSKEIRDEIREFGHSLGIAPRYVIARPAPD